MPLSVNDRKRKQDGHYIRNNVKTSVDNRNNVKTSVDKFLRISQNANVELTREGMGKNATQPKGDSIQVENRSNNLKKRMVTPTFYVIKWNWQAYSACH